MDYGSLKTPLRANLVSLLCWLGVLIEELILQAYEMLLATAVESLCWKEQVCLYSYRGVRSPPIP